MRPFGYFCGGMSTTWWSDKHNTHHARTNEVGIDEDIATDPALFLWAPDPKNDSPARKYQGIFWPIPMSFLFVLWRFDSFSVAIRRKLWKEVFGLTCHYAFMLSFVSPATFLGALFVSGFMTAVITTVTHQGEELFFDGAPDFVEAQYRSTRDATCNNPFSEWLWGGMQYQLEHHLFPTMPRYKYPALIPQVGSPHSPTRPCEHSHFHPTPHASRAVDLACRRSACTRSSPSLTGQQVQKFADENNLDFRVTGEWKLLKMNIDIYKDVATRPAVPGAKASRPETGKADIGSILANAGIGGSTVSDNK